jgi:NADH-quinone oxidoreductase subunit L
MNELLVNLIVFSPLVGFLINGIFGQKLHKSLSGLIGTLAVAISFVCSIMTFIEVQHYGAFHVNLFTWLSVDTFQITFGFYIDQLSTWMMLIISGIGSLIHLYSIGYMHEDEGFYRFFAYLNLFVFSMFLLVMGSNYIMLFFGWEGVGLCSYLLIGFWYKNVEYGHAARKAFIMNRIGDLGLILGIFLIFNTFGSLQYTEVASLAHTGVIKPEIFIAITILLFIGAMGKSAQIPLYTWLPDAMAGPTPVSALIHAATMVTAGIYLVVRNNFLFSLAPMTMDIILIIGISTSIFAALIGLFQNDIKKVLAYSTVSQLGLMFVALGVGAYSTAMFHVTTHAFFKALLFLGAGSVIHAMGGEQDIRKMGGLKSEINLTHWTFLVGTLAIIGFPLFSGFFSKDEILEKVFSHSPLVYGLTIFSAGLTIVYMLRLYFVTFWGTFKGTDSQKAHIHESPSSMTIPLIVLAILSLFGGIINLPAYLGASNAQFLSHWISQCVGFSSHSITHHEIGHSTETLLIASAVILVFVLGAAVYGYFKKKEFTISMEEQKGFAKWGENKFYVDELYQTVFVRSFEKMSDLFFNYVEKYVIQPLTFGISNVISFINCRMKTVQNGNVEYYLLYITLAYICFFVILFLSSLSK